MQELNITALLLPYEKLFTVFDKIFICGCCKDFYGHNGVELVAMYCDECLVYIMMKLIKNGVNRTDEIREAIQNN